MTVMHNIHTVSIVTRGAITSIQHSKSYTCTVLHGPEATTRYYGAEPAPTVASHAQQLNFLLSSTFAEETVLLVGSKSKKASLLLKGVLGCTR